MNSYIAELKKHITEDIGRTAHEFLDTGTNLYYSHINSESSCGQSALNSLTIGVEFMLKAFFAEKNLGLIFKNIPPDVRMFLSCPESVPHFFEWRRFEPDIRSDKYETLNLEDCLASFYIFYPQIKQLLLPHAKYLLKWGALSGHMVLPELSSFDFQRTGYAVLQILSVLGRETSSQLVYYTVTDRDREFLKSFENEREERVKIVLDQARQKMFSADAEHTTVIVARDWDTFVTQCPVCKYNGYLAGYTEIALGRDDEGPHPSLDFFATTFECDMCGLRLNDIEEMKLANMSILYDRSDDLDRWFHEHNEFSDWMLD
ncbi:hypothetical protein ACFL47_05220 [Candidatus Latescibacterota bacterium]